MVSSNLVSSANVNGLATLNESNISFMKII